MTCTFWRHPMIALPNLHSSADQHDREPMPGLEHLHISETWRRWIKAYGMVRRLDLQPVDGGWWLDVCRREQSGRYFLREADIDLFQSLAKATEAPAVHFHLPLPHGIMAQYLPDRWTLAAPEYLMAAALQGSQSRPIPIDTELAINIEDQQVRVGLLDRSGFPRARGTCVIIGNEAVLDQIVTERGFRRQGLGTVVVTALMDHAFAFGAQRGLLVATAEGRPFYETLGWTVLTDVTTIISALGTRASAHMGVIAKQ